MAIELVVGLGNPGTQYASTRHNCGFRVVERLGDRWHIALQPQRRFRGRYGEGAGPAGKLRLLCPDTFMNRSGESVRSVVDWFKLAPASVLVVYDDIDLPFGRLRLRQSGSAGGHNGMKSLIQHLGTQDFPRVRVGVGAPAGERDTVSHVLGGFTPREQQYLADLLDAAADAVEMVLKQDMPTAMNRFNPLDLCPPVATNG
jgi:PTH1 family peptidyl-tRNA hydrolase